MFPQTNVDTKSEILKLRINRKLKDRIRETSEIKKHFDEQYDMQTLAKLFRQMDKAIKHAIRTAK